MDEIPQTVMDCFKISNALIDSFREQEVPLDIGIAALALALAGQWKSKSRESFLEYCGTAYDASNAINGN